MTVKNKTRQQMTFRLVFITFFFKYPNFIIKKIIL